ncbi:hypothetical protein MHM39_03720 [Phaeobacter sp. CNT1-3]|nr:hypothetical protein [Phaeobacter sp. CNT1-3]
MRTIALLLIFLAIPIGSAAQQRFSCSFGDRGACLGFGETVCSSSGKCVNENAACFDIYQCNYEGFTCKSNVTECVDEYNGLLARFNSLVGDYNELLEERREVHASFERALDELAETQNELQDVIRDLRESEITLADLKVCIEGLSRSDDPRLCLP